MFEDVTYKWAFRATKRLRDRLELYRYERKTKYLCNRLAVSKNDRLFYLKIQQVLSDSHNDNIKGFVDSFSMKSEEGAFRFVILSRVWEINYEVISAFNLQLFYAQVALIRQIVETLIALLYSESVDNNYATNMFIKGSDLRIRHIKGPGGVLEKIKAHDKSTGEYLEDLWESYSNMFHISEGHRSHFLWHQPPKEMIKGEQYLSKLMISSTPVPWPHREKQMVNDYFICVALILNKLGLKTTEGEEYFKILFQNQPKSN